MAHRVLVVTPVALDASDVGAAVSADGAETLVVVPATRQSRLQWLANDEDAARAEADRAAAETEAATGAGTVAAATGEADPVQAVEDALREFRADEIVVVTRPDADADWLEGGAAAEALRRFDLPVRHLVAGAGGVEDAPLEAVRPYSESHEVARGSREKTPAALLGGVGGVVATVAGAVIVVALLLYLLL